MSRFSEMHSLSAPVLSWHVLHFLQLSSVNVICLISRNTKTQQVYCTLLLFPKEENNTFSAISLSAHAKTMSSLPPPLTVQDHYNAIFFCIYCANAKKISPPIRKSTLCYNTKEQIPPCRRVFQKLDEC